MTKKNSQSLCAVVTCCALALVCAAAAPTTGPSTAPALTSGVLAVGDKAALGGAIDQDVEVEGDCTAAAWSNSGKVMTVEFAGTDETHFSAVVFSKYKDAMDKAFDGDAAKSFTGAKLRVKGKLREYGGKGGRKGHPEIIVNDASQVTIVTPTPTSQPS